MMTIAVRVEIREVGCTEPCLIDSHDAKSLEARLYRLANDYPNHVATVIHAEGGNDRQYYLLYRGLCQEISSEAHSKIMQSDLISGKSASALGQSFWEKLFSSKSTDRLQAKDVSASIQRLWHKHVDENGRTRKQPLG